MELLASNVCTFAHVTSLTHRTDQLPTRLVSDLWQTEAGDLLEVVLARRESVNPRLTDSRERFDSTLF